MTAKRHVTRSRLIERGEIDPRKLVPHPRNWRLHEQAQLSAVAGLIDDVGYVKPVLANRRSGFLLDGHLRVALAVQRGERKIPVDWVNLTEAEEIKVLVALDTTVGLAKTDEDLLASLRAEIHTESAGLAALVAAMGEHAIDSPLAEAFGAVEREPLPEDIESAPPPSVDHDPSWRSVPTGRASDALRG